MNALKLPKATDPRIEFFDQLAPHWDTDCSHPEETLRRLAALNGTLGFAPGQKVLEVGCGTGQLTRWLESLVAPGHVTAVDFSAGMLAQARQRHTNGDYRTLDICGEKPSSGSFDVVLCFNAFPHFRDKGAALRNIAGCLKPDGQMLVVHLVGSAELNAFHQNLKGPVHHDLLPTAEEWRNLLGATGLRLVSLTDRTDLFLLKAALSSTTP